MSVNNRNKNWQKAQIDVAIANKEAAQEAKNLLEQVANEISRQFADIILSAPKIENKKHKTRAQETAQ